MGTAEELGFFPTTPLLSERLPARGRRVGNGAIGWSGQLRMSARQRGLKGTETIDHDLMQRVRTRERGHPGRRAV
jgi:hypothetical protein